MSGYPAASGLRSFSRVNTKIAEDAEIAEEGVTSQILAVSFFIILYADFLCTLAALGDERLHPISMPPFTFSTWPVM